MLLTGLAIPSAEAAPIKPFVLSSSRSSSGSLTVAVTGKRVRLPAAHRTILIRCIRLTARAGSTTNTRNLCQGGPSMPYRVPGLDVAPAHDPVGGGSFLLGFAGRPPEVARVSTTLDDGTTIQPPLLTLPKRLRTRGGAPRVFLARAPAPRRFVQVVAVDAAGATTGGALIDQTHPYQ